MSEPVVQMPRSHSLATALAEGPVREAEPGMSGRVANRRGIAPRVRDEGEAVEGCRNAAITLHELIAAGSAGEG